MPLLDLPNEILLLIGENLPLGDLVRLTGVTHHLKNLLDPLRIKFTHDMKDELVVWAVKSGHVLLAEKLLEIGADANARRNFLDLSLLEYAASKGYESLAKLLLENGAEVDGYSGAMYDLKTPLHLAVLSRQTGIVKLLLEKGANIYIKSGRRTALFAALYMENTEAAELIMDKSTQFHGGSALHFTLYSNDPASFHAILRRSPALINLQCRRGYTCLSWAVQMRRIYIVSTLLEYGANTSIGDRGDGKTPLHHAAFYGDIVLVTMLVQGGADVNALDSKNSSVLCDATRGVKVDENGNTLYNHCEVIRLLRIGGASDSGSDGIA